MHKRRATGGKQKPWRKKRKYELGRQPANTKISSNKIVWRVRCFMFGIHTKMITIITTIIILESRSSTQT
ncbi:hypothetical protein L6452_23867 [Arctium lappa]|uniref:Uncharacterized protein n=1 Tax=Arctium lappa TaxID=4217 RepID=A0ACB9A8X5_ARCLA|nr:hypothetical protein L6452_23867 [Arctium lappa]